MPITANTTTSHTKGNIIRGESLRDLRPYGILSAAVAIGVFDGLHTGHQAVIRKLCEESKRLNTTPVLVTFAPHPKSVLDSGNEPPMLISYEERTRLAEELGCKAVITLPFTRKLAELSPDDFLNHVLFGQGVEIKAVCVGTEWRFGRGASGGAELLTERSSHGGFEFYPVPEVILNGNKVSSSMIRKAISEGDIELAKKALGRRPFITGEVVHGNRIATEQLHCATANVQASSGAVPGDGVYAAFAITEAMPGRRIPAVVNIGMAPTFQVGERRIEAHLMQAEAIDLYGETLTLEFSARLRSERTFATAELLMEQIRTDSKQAQEILSNEQKERM